MDQKKIVQFLTFWVVNTVVLLVSSAILGGNVVLGNATVTKPMAAVFSGLIITTLNYLVPLVVIQLGGKNALDSTTTTVGNMKVKTENVWGGIYFVSNALIVWVIKRFALVIGLGVSSIMYVVIVAILLSFAQWAAARATGAMEKPKKS